MENDKQTIFNSDMGDRQRIQHMYEIADELGCCVRNEDIKHIPNYHSLLNQIYFSLEPILKKKQKIKMINVMRKIDELRAKVKKDGNSFRVPSGLFTLLELFHRQLLHTKQELGLGLSLKSKKKTEKEKFRK